MSHKIFLSVFALFLCLPMMYYSLTKDHKDLIESVSNFDNPLRIKEQIIQRKGEFEKDLFVPYRFISEEIFKSNAIPHKVVMGKNGWLFLGDSYSDVLAESRGILLFDSVQLGQIEKNIDKSFQSYRQSGIEPFLVVAPNKHSIYADKLFSSKYLGLTKCKQVEKAFQNTENEIINLGKNFGALNTPLYHKTNSHWNDLGAFYAYVTLMEKLKSEFPELEMLSFDQLKSIDTTSHQEDLSKMLGIKIPEKKKNFIVTPSVSTKLEGRYKTPRTYKNTTAPYELRFKTNRNNLKVLIFRDSFSEAWIKYLSESFGETIFIWDYQRQQQIIDTEKPDILIQQIVERELDVLLK